MENSLMTYVFVIKALRFETLIAFGLERFETIDELFEVL